MRMPRATVIFNIQFCTRTRQRSRLVDRKEIPNALFDEYFEATSDSIREKAEEKREPHAFDST